MTDGVTADRDFTARSTSFAGKPGSRVRDGATLGTVNFMKEAKRRQLAEALRRQRQSTVTAEALQSGGDAIDGMVAPGAFDPQSPQIAKARGRIQEAARAGNHVLRGHRLRGRLPDQGRHRARASRTRRKRWPPIARSSAMPSPRPRSRVPSARKQPSADREMAKPGVNLIVKNGQFVLWK